MRIIKFQDFISHLKEDSTFSGLLNLLNTNTPILQYGSIGNYVKFLQKNLIDLGFLNIAAPTGNFLKKTQKAVKDFQIANHLTPSGTVDQKMWIAISKAYKNKTHINPNVPKKDQTKPITNRSLSVSEQVKKQLKYLSDNNFLANDKFTILDDKLSKVHTFLPGYQLGNTYNVITGQSKGDDLKTKTLGDWLKSNWTTVAAKYFKNLGGWEETRKYIDEEYFKSWKIKNTPAGVFKRANPIKNFLNDKVLTSLAEIKYGKRFITWETCSGETIPFGFHGTEIPKRVEVLTSNQILNPSKANMSFGCINFQEKDIIEIYKFIDANQFTIWLPDATNDIVKISEECLTGKKPEAQTGMNRIDQYHYDNPGLRIGGGLD